MSPGMTRMSAKARRKKREPPFGPVERHGDKACRPAQGAAPRGGGRRGRVGAARRGGSLDLTSQDRRRTGSGRGECSRTPASRARLDASSEAGPVWTRHRRLQPGGTSPSVAGGNRAQDRSGQWSSRATLGDTVLFRCNVRRPAPTQAPATTVPGKEYNGLSG